MEGICGVFNPNLIPDWFAKLGPLIAATVAIGLFEASRRREARHRRAKRDYLSVLLTYPTQEVFRMTRGLLKEFDMGDKAPSAKGWVRYAAEGNAPIHAIERLFDLHAQLIAVADKDDDRIAAFIEACRVFKYRMSKLAKLHSSPNYIFDDLPVEFEKIIADEVEKLHQELNRLNARCHDVIRVLDYRTPPEPFDTMKSAPGK